MAAAAHTAGPTKAPKTAGRAPRQTLLLCCCCRGMPSVLVYATALFVVQLLHQVWVRRLLWSLVRPHTQKPGATHKCSTKQKCALSDSDSHSHMPCRTHHLSNHLSPYFQTACSLLDPPGPISLALLSALNPTTQHLPVTSSADCWASKQASANGPHRTPNPPQKNQLPCQQCYQVTPPMHAQQPRLSPALTLGSAAPCLCPGAPAPQPPCAQG